MFQVWVTVDPYVKLKSNPVPNGPNCHSGGLVATPGGAVTWAVKVAVNGAGPVVAEALMVTEQCATEGAAEFDRGCEAANPPMTTTIATIAITARTMLDGLPIRTSSSVD